jgi:hypothetical protein
VVNSIRGISNEEFTNSKKDVIDCNNHFKVCHQNIRGLNDRLNELSNCVNSETPHIICFSEHHLKECEIKKIDIKQYVLGTKVCRQFLKNGGICMRSVQKVSSHLIF